MNLLNKIKVNTRFFFNQKSKKYELQYQINVPSFLIKFSKWRSIRRNGFSTKKYIISDPTLVKGWVRRTFKTLKDILEFENRTY